MIKYFVVYWCLYMYVLPDSRDCKCVGFAEAGKECFNSNFYFNRDSAFSFYNKINYKSADIVYLDSGFCLKPGLRR